MAKRILNRKELRADFDAAERREKGEDEETEEEEDDADEDEDEEEAETDKEAGEEEEEEEEAPKKPARKKAPAKPKAPAKSRSRAAKSVRLRVVWGVFNNSNQCIATYAYPKRKDAEEHAAKLTTDKKSTHFIQPVKEPLPAP